MFSILFIVVKFLFCRIWTFSFSSSIFKIVKISRIGRYKRNDTFFDSLKFFFTVNMGNKFVQLAQQIFIVAQSRESFYFSFPYWQSLLFIFFFWLDRHSLFSLSLSQKKREPFPAGKLQLCCSCKSGNTSNILSATCNATIIAPIHPSIKRINRTCLEKRFHSQLSVSNFRGHFRKYSKNSIVCH